MTAAVISIALHGVLFVVGWMLFGRIRALPAGVRQKSSLRLSLIIPARNEESRLPELLRSVNQGRVPPFEVVVADDGSEDGTAAVARSFGARVAPCGTAPPGWAGKTWACRQGAAAAQGDVLLFLDADTFLEPEGLHNILSFMDASPGALSVQPYHVIKQPYESLSAFFNLMQVVSSGAFTLWARRPPRLRMFGPALAIRREDYVRAGGHELVKDKILENFFLSEKLWAAGIPITCVTGKNSLGFRMYPEGIQSLIRGWSKALSKGASQSSLLLLIGSIGWFTGALGTARHLATTLIVGPGDFLPILIGFYFLYVIQIFWVLRRIGNFGFFAALLFPIGMAFFAGVFLFSAGLSLFGGSVVWKGRRV